jgi:uncharacterized Zn finger protein
MSIFKCPSCGKFNEAKTINIRKAVGENGQRRRRECVGCGNRYSTVELIVPEGKRGYPKEKPLYFEEDYHRDEDIDTDTGNRFEHRMRQRR